MISENEHCPDCGEVWDYCACWDDPDDDRNFSRCGGEGRQEGNPIEDFVNRWGEIPCKACGGSGKDQTIW